MANSPLGNSFRAPDVDSHDVDSDKKFQNSGSAPRQAAELRHATQNSILFLLGKNQLPRKFGGKLGRPGLVTLPTLMRVNKVIRKGVKAEQKRIAAQSKTGATGSVERYMLSDSATFHDLKAHLQNVRAAKEELKAHTHGIQQLPYDPLEFNHDEGRDLSTAEKDAYILALDEYESRLEEQVGDIDRSDAKLENIVLDIESIVLTDEIISDNPAVRHHLNQMLYLAVEQRRIPRKLEHFLRNFIPEDKRDNVRTGFQSIVDAYSGEGEDKIEFHAAVSYIVRKNQNATRALHPEYIPRKRYGDSIDEIKAGTKERIEQIGKLGAGIRMEVNHGGREFHLYTKRSADGAPIEVAGTEKGVNGSKISGQLKVEDTDGTVRLDIKVTKTTGAEEEIEDTGVRFQTTRTRQGFIQGKRSAFVGYLETYDVADGIEKRGAEEVLAESNVWDAIKKNATDLYSPGGAIPTPGAVGGRPEFQAAVRAHRAGPAIVVADGEDRLKKLINSAPAILTYQLNDAAVIFHELTDMTAEMATNASLKLRPKKLIERPNMKAAIESTTVGNADYELAKDDADFLKQLQEMIFDFILTFNPGGGLKAIYGAMEEEIDQLIARTSSPTLDLLKSSAGIKTLTQRLLVAEDADAFLESERFKSAYWSIPKAVIEDADVTNAIYSAIMAYRVGTDVQFGQITSEPLVDSAISGKGASTSSIIAEPHFRVKAEEVARANGITVI